MMGYIYTIGVRLINCVLPFILGHLLLRSGFHPPAQLLTQSAGERAVLYISAVPGGRIQDVEYPEHTHGSSLSLIHIREAMIQIVVVTFGR